MKILVTGGAGFIGSHLAERLVKEGHEVHIWDDLSSGQKKNISSGVISVFLNIIGSSGWGRKSNFDQIYHLACPASPVWYQKDPVKTMLTNVVGTNNMLRIARHHRAKILLTSTSEVYGDPLEHPQKETYLGNVNCTGPRACYDEGKRAAESLMYDYQRKYDVDVRVARLFNTYGPRMRPDDGRVISNFIVQALKDKAFTLYGDGFQTRSFCYVDDTVEGLIKLMNSDISSPVNLGNPEEVSIGQLARRIAQKCGVDNKYDEVEKGIRVAMIKKLENDPEKRKPDISKAKELLGWEPKVSLDEGLKKTIEYFKNEFNITKEVVSI